MNLVLGISLMAIGALGLIAIISYNALDKSLNTISDAPPENFLGVPGSYASDIMVQFFGVLSIIVPATFVIFGFYKIIKKLKIINMPLWIFRTNTLKLSDDLLNKE